MAELMPLFEQIRQSECDGSHSAALCTIRVGYSGGAVVHKSESSTSSSMVGGPQADACEGVRERTTKSSAMGRASFSAGTPDSSFSEEGGTSGFHLHTSKRKASAPVSSRSSYNTTGDSQSSSRGGSRPQSRGPGSRPGSRPPSRASSEVSLDSNDGGRTPMKRTPSFTGRTRTPSSQTSGVQRSSSLRKASAPVKSSTGTVNGTGTRAISVSSRTKIPVLAGPASDWERTNLSGSASNLSVAGTPLRTRTPSGSSSTGGTTKLVRKSSGASDTPTGVARKTGIMEPKREVPVIEMVNVTSVASEELTPHTTGEVPVIEMVNVTSVASEELTPHTTGEVPVIEMVNVTSVASEELTPHTTGEVSVIEMVNVTSVATEELTPHTTGEVPVIEMVNVTSVATRN
ncbi:hypothetical protein GWK47_039971 [Chionoecetes opilio]|uniref:Uncharacterized protein n=1 Tax=Chionoecetes opilio TaxID=41210 RepID=A0A8J4YKG5_CHIOP|nr:hypothetical protein GWK47_039971 [Chionoecetes opilio]